MRLGDLDALRLAFVEKREKTEKCIHDKVDRAVTKIVLGWCIDKIAAAPTIDPEGLRPKGRWMDVKPIINGVLWRCRCGLCGCPQDYKHNYCPNCGAKMENDNG